MAADERRSSRRVSHSAAKAASFQAVSSSMCLASGSVVICTSQRQIIGKSEMARAAVASSAETCPNRSDTCARSCTPRLSAGSAVFAGAAVDEALAIV